MTDLKLKVATTIAASSALFMTSAFAASLDVTIYERGGDGQAAECYSSVVSGLSSKGDGFLAVRSGPGPNYGMIDKLYNGDVVVIYDKKGPWLGVMFGSRTGNCGFLGNGKRPLPYKGNKGWIHGKWTRDLAG